MTAQNKIPYIYGTATLSIDIDVWDDNNTVTIVVGNIIFRCDINVAQELRNKITAAITSIDP